MFTTPCFIRKNTPELKEKLEGLGYISHIFNNNDTNNIYVDKLGTYISVDIENHPSYIDCGTNEELFLALAALQDDTDKNQWVTDGEIWVHLLEGYQRVPLINYILSKGHKATVEEIIEHFKDK